MLHKGLPQFRRPGSSGGGVQVPVVFQVDPENGVRRRLGIQLLHGLEPRSILYGNRSHTVWWALPMPLYKAFAKEIIAVMDILR
jgi:hypothetical protein